MTHSLTPFTTGVYRKDAIFSGGEEKRIVVCNGIDNPDDTDFLLKCVNNHDALVDALNKCLHALDAASATIPFQGKINSMAHCTVDDAKMRAEDLLKQMTEDNLE